MALTISQINSVYLALLDRPAQSLEYTLNDNFSSTSDVARVIINTQNRSNIDFVKGLYNTLLNREPDPMGLICWSGLLNLGLDRISLEKQFIATVALQGKADPNNADFINLQNSNFISNLYNNLLDRNSDADGLKFWTNELISGFSRADIVENFINAIKANPNTEDNKIFTNKIAIADNFTQSDFTANTEKIVLSSDIAKTIRLDVADTGKKFSDFLANGDEIIINKVQGGTWQLNQGISQGGSAKISTMNGGYHTVEQSGSFIAQSNTSYIIDDYNDEELDIFIQLN